MMPLKSPLAVCGDGTMTQCRGWGKTKRNRHSTWQSNGSAASELSPPPENESNMLEDRRTRQDGCIEVAGLAVAGHNLPMAFCFRPKFEIYQGRQVRALETARMVCCHSDREINHDHA
jgi:hypothetical protein